jgi:hypothetical protein
MTSWIFQGNPNRFDIDGYLAFAPDRITWLVNQLSHDNSTWRSGVPVAGTW